MSTQRPPPSVRRRPRPSRCRSRTTADTPPRAASYLAVGSGDALGAAWTARFQVWTSEPAYWFPRSFLFHIQSHLNQKTGPRHGPRPLVPIRAPERGPCGLFKGGKPCAYVYVKAVGFGCVAICVAIGETKRPPTGSSPQSSRGPNFIFVPLQVKECFADDSCRDSPLVPQHDVAHDVFGCR